MSFFSKLSSVVTGFFRDLKAEITQLPHALARWKKERHWKRTKRRVSWAKTVCERRLENQLFDEHLQRVMTARLCDVRLAGIGQSRIDALHRAGIHTAYDVHRNGPEGLCQVPSIGTKLASSLLEWAQTHLPDSFTINKRDSEYIRRIRILKREHFGLTADSGSPPPQTNRSQRSNNYRTNSDFDTDDEEEHADYHAVLGVQSDASQQQIKEAYRQRMREYHPDKVAHLGPDLRSLAESKAKQINEAYEALSAE